jgi:hypothetical protein
MTIVVLERTKCYTCEIEIMARIGEVHPLCADCQIEFDDWFQRQLSLFK